MGAVRPKVVLQEAKKLEELGELKEASRKYASLIQPLVKRGKSSEALIIIDKVLELSPSSTRLYLNKALCLLELNREREALDETEKFATAALRQKRLSQYIELIEDKAKAHPRILQKFFEKILSVERTRADVFIYLARVLYSQGQIVRAFEMVFSGLRVDPNCELGVESLKAWIAERGKKGDFQYVESWVNGDCSLDEVKERMRVWVKDLSANPVDNTIGEKPVTSQTNLKSLGEEDVPALKNLIQDLEEELGNSPNGIESIASVISEFKQKALSLLKEESTTLFDLAVAFREMGLLSEAKETLLQIGKFDEKYHDAQSLLGVIEYETGAVMASLDIFQILLRSEPLEEDCRKNALYHIVRIYIELQDFKKASQFADKLSKIDSNYRNLPRLRSEIWSHLEK